MDGDHFTSLPLSIKDSIEKFKIYTEKEKELSAKKQLCAKKLSTIVQKYNKTTTKARRSLAFLVVVDVESELKREE